MINSKASIVELIEKYLETWRPVAWENDISCHSLDVADFKNEPPIADRIDAFTAQCRNLPKAMRDRFDIAEMLARDTFPIPSDSDREGYAPGNDPQYWVSGLKDYIRMMDVAIRNKVEVKTYFDLGCATGRVARHVVAQSDVETVWCSDINARHIRWMLEFMPRKVRPIANHCIPSIPIPDNSVDLISAFSVFTHIDTFETCWLAELRRILRPGGLAYLTVHNEATWQVLAKELDNPDNRLIQSLLNIDPALREKLQQPMPPGRAVYRFTDFGPYRAQVFHSNDYLERVWGRFLDIQEILDCHHVRQSVVVLKK